MCLVFPPGIITSSSMGPAVANTRAAAKLLVDISAKLGGVGAGIVVILSIVTDPMHVHLRPSSQRIDFTCGL
jgi:hypothetical protein